MKTYLYYVPKTNHLLFTSDGSRVEFDLYDPDNGSYSFTAYYIGEL